MMEVTAKRCGEKRAYLDRKDAEKVMREMLGSPRVREAERRQLNVYECPECRLWHVGKTRKDGRS